MIVLAELDHLTTLLGRLDGLIDGCDDHSLAEGVAELATFRTRCDAVWLRVVAAVESRGLHRAHGARDAATWIAGLCGDRTGSARKEVDLAQRLAHTPIVAEALATGVVSRAKAAELVRAAALPEAAQEALVAMAVDAPVERVAAAVEQARLTHGAAAAPVEPALHVTRRADHAVVEATLDLVDAEVLEVALATMVDSQGLPVEVPYPQRRARALAGLARYFLDHQDRVPSGRVGRPHILVLVDLEVLEARAGGSARLASGAVITGDQARRLAEDANISRLITTGRSEPLDVGRATRTVPPAVAKAVIARDRCCRYRGCAAPPWACDVHHRQPWAQGGATAVDNLGLLCWYHHELAHRFGPHHLLADPLGDWYLPQCSPTHCTTAAA